GARAAADPAAGAGAPRARPAARRGLDGIARRVHHGLTDLELVEPCGRFGGTLEPHSDTALDSLRPAVLHALREEIAEAMLVQVQAQVAAEDEEVPQGLIDASERLLDGGRVRLRPL